ncbi:a93e2000-6583-4561-9a72-fd2fe4af30f0 [Sclerotinia trifoliorum]|uniref:A93e2000-6583-4561-9a72-fd2fe4af30f0 n=1 Tax=Sclerotinia trifoliorum TaxID=28548 RepID=A0A8H2ZME7_9HELO|nr:a93e2000-6583-4561-9a72-fd2fe4af30f0 [Sclerotinia trifoliorum]
MSCAGRAVSGPRCLYYGSAWKIAEDGLSSDQSQTATANSTIIDFSEWQQTILIARAKVHAEDYNEFASVLLAVARPQPPLLLSPVTNRFIVKQKKSDKLSAFRDER